MIYVSAFFLGIVFGIVATYIRIKNLEKKQLEIATFISETPQSRILRPFAKSNKLKPKVNNDDRAVERESQL